MILLKLKYLIFVPALIMGTLITISSSSWFSAWIGLEINLMSMAPILVNKSTPKSIEASIKYFMFQALASMILIFFIVFFYSFNLNELPWILNLIITASLLVKTGMAPFQFWLPQVMMCSDWHLCLILLSWQKVAPFILISFNLNFLTYTAIISSALVGMLGGINSTNLKIIVVYSSILHSAWMLSVVSTNMIFWINYMIIYTLILLSVTYPIMNLRIKSLNSCYLLNKPSLYKTIFLMNFMSMAGMPPFLGFSLKIFSILLLFKSNFNSLLLISLILASLISFYFYMRVLYSSLFNLNSSLVAASPSFMTPSLLVSFGSLSLAGNLGLPVFMMLT